MILKEGVKMSKLSRRTFLRLMGQGTAVVGMGLSGGALFQTGCAKAKETDTSGKYQIFQPGEYFDWEKAVIEERLAKVEKPPKSQDQPIVVKEDDLLDYNRRWELYNPLFREKEYAQKAGYKDIPARPCFQNPASAISAVSIKVPKKLQKWAKSFSICSGKILNLSLKVRLSNKI